MHHRDMKTVRSVVLVATSASMLVAGWAAGSGFVNPTDATNSAGAVSLNRSNQGTSGASSAPASGGSATSSSATPSTSATEASGTFDGAAVRTPYGSYQAELTVTAGKITNIAMLQTGNKDGTSQQISGYALPQLIKAVLQKQTANVGYVSGASYTTQGFEGSVQSAMQAAGLA